MTQASLRTAPARGADKLAWILTRAHLIAGSLSGLGIAAIFAIVIFEIVVRYFFSSPTSWSVEISTYILMGVAYLGAAYAHGKEANVRVTVVLDAVPRHIRIRLEEAAAWSSLFFALVAVWQIALFTHANYANATISYILLVPQWIPNIPILVGFILLSMTLLDEIRQLRPPIPAFRAWLGLVVLAAAAAALFLYGGRAGSPVLGQLDLGVTVIAAACLVAALAWSDWRTLLLAVITCGGVGAAMTYAQGLPVGYAAIVLFVVVIAVFLLGIRIAFGLGLIALFSLYLLLPFPLPRTIAERGFTSLESFSLTALPMFVLMGSLLVRSGIATELFDTLMKWMGRLPGGIAHAAVGACSIFAAVSGSSVATAATIGSVACPEMVRHGYSRRLAYGSVAAGGTLGILIPPSVPLIIYGTLAGVSISKLFIGAVIPGLLLTALFMAGILTWAFISPRSVPAAGRVTWQERIASIGGTGPFALLILCVLGSLYLGIVTATEAGAIGALMAALLCAWRRSFNATMVWESLLETVIVTGFILLIVFSASLLTFIFDYLRVSQILLEGIAGYALSALGVFAILCVFYIVLGMFLDSISLITLTLPVVFPLVVSMGYDPVWFGIVLVILVETGLITPPIGLNLFVLQGLGKVPLREVAYGALPFVFLMIAFLAILYAVPEIITWLPEYVR